MADNKHVEREFFRMQALEVGTLSFPFSSESLRHSTRLERVFNKRLLNRCTDVVPMGTGQLKGSFRDFHNVCSFSLVALNTQPDISGQGPMLNKKDILRADFAFLKSISATPLLEASCTSKIIWGHFSRENALQ
uniref:Uncharacterized protein n=1 Tax=Pipistrellus kuhlii TaxID=59472 RepID=A0A7J7Y949_PIPKU|nr:hypothetical protein mPipKuh1_010310 [Pipistrellus kuhlii]